MTHFKDHFSQVADAYAQWRPGYPDALFDALAAWVPASARVWEPGCGSGQATRGLARRFAHVHATDPSAAQVAQHWARAPALAGPAAAACGQSDAGGSADQAPAADAAAAAKVTLAVEPGEATALASASAGLVVVAQALHWFDHDRFFAECERVLRPGGVLAAWVYQDLVLPGALEQAAAGFRQAIEPHWPAERADVDAGYAHYRWPFPPLPAPACWLTAEWTLPQLLGYLGSLSATARCRQATGVDPVAAHAPEISTAWGPPGQVRTVRWPLVLHLRRRPG